MATVTSKLQRAVANRPFPITPPLAKIDECGLVRLWRQWNTVPDPHRYVNLSTADVSALSALIYASPSRAYAVFNALASYGIALFGVLFVFLPLSPVIAFAIKLESPGPVFFRQTRVGWKGLPLTVLKFRTMVQEAVHSTPTFIPPDHLITKVGRFLRRHRLDEFPQLLHVLQGKMALIGPRPNVSSVLAGLHTRAPVATLRQAVKPGVTGWGTVNGGRFGDSVGNLQYDLYWMTNRGIRFDLEILYRSLRVILTGQGGG